ncbi:MAG: hypothetical protein H6958_01475 [Chromatiaceae bacterium]|nr:hypothetical protein [Chromatiaceae bacterium]
MAQCVWPSVISRSAPAALVALCCRLFVARHSRLFSCTGGARRVESRSDGRPSVLSPAIGVTSAALIAVWQARLGHLLGLEKLAWNEIQPEYDPFKYGSFAVNAGDVVYRLTSEIQRRITALQGQGRLEKFPPILAFSSVVDATVSTAALVKGLFARLPAGGHELVLFDINRRAEIEPILRWNPSAIVGALQQNPDRAYIPSASLPTKISITRRWSYTAWRVEARGQIAWRLVCPGRRISTPWHTWPCRFRHAIPCTVAAPSSQARDPAGRDRPARERARVLQIGAADMLRLRWNPFYPFVQQRLLSFFSLDGQHSANRAFGDFPPTQ